jgi:hemerythrin superfamily protein
MKGSWGKLLAGIGNGLGGITGLFAVGETAGEENGRELLEAVEEAHREWDTAKALFENVTDSDLVDYASFQINAAQRRYMYLLRQAQKKGLKAREWR